MNTMKKAVMTALRKIEYLLAQVPSPGEGEVLIHIKRIGICDSDIHVYHSENPYTSYPIVQGQETSGEVAAVGRGVTSLAIGDRVPETTMKVMIRVND